MDSYPLKSSSIVYRFIKFNAYRGLFPLIMRTYPHEYIRLATQSLCSLVRSLITISSFYLVLIISAISLVLQYSTYGYDIVTQDGLINNPFYIFAIVFLTIGSIFLSFGFCIFLSISVARLAIKLFNTVKSIMSIPDKPKKKSKSLVIQYLKDRHNKVCRKINIIKE